MRGSASSRLARAAISPGPSRCAGAALESCSALPSVCGPPATSQCATSHTLRLDELWHRRAHFAGPAALAAATCTPVQQAARHFLPCSRHSLGQGPVGATRGFAGQPHAARRGVRGLQRRSGEQGLYLVALVVGMVGLTYASVPLYRMFCQATGFGGTVKQGQTVEEKLRERRAAAQGGEPGAAAAEAAAAAREVTVSFNADVSDGLPWRFQPTQASVRVRPGQSVLAFYTAANQGANAITGVSTYNVAPQQAGVYFNKIQCFCFEEQKLRAGEVVDMPVFFYIDPEFALDPRMKTVDHLTLSYTFFKVAEDEDRKEDVPVTMQSTSSLPSQLQTAQA